jgi:hypothetical protein
VVGVDKYSCHSVVIMLVIWYNVGVVLPLSEREVCRAENNGLWSRVGSVH